MQYPHSGMEQHAYNYGGLSTIDSEYHTVRSGLKKTETVTRIDPIVDDIACSGKSSSALQTDEAPPRCFDEDGHRLRLTPARGHAHGHLGCADWAAPYMTKFCESEARPGYASTLAHEYQDEPEVLEEKVALLARLLVQSKACLLYTGAGLSTSAGIGDYATRTATGDRVQSALKSPIIAEPTFAHYALGDICKRDLIKQWVQQNHDGLPQKAGVPQSLLNEIHGAWFDPSNPVVKMDGNLRGDLFDKLLQWEQLADLVISVGTSMSGMNSDRVFTTAATKATKQLQQGPPKKEGEVFGGVIIGVQCTQYDSLSSLRLFGKIDEVMNLLINKLGLDAPLRRMASLSIPITSKQRVGEHYFLIPYDKNTGLYSPILQKKGTALTLLDLSPGQRVKLTSGPYKGDVGEVMYISAQGMYQIQFSHELSKKTKVRRHFMRPLGWWWIAEAISGAVDYVPVVNVSYYF